VGGGGREGVIRTKGKCGLGEENEVDKLPAFVNSYKGLSEENQSRERTQGKRGDPEPGPTVEFNALEKGPKDQGKK